MPLSQIFERSKRPLLYLLTALMAYLAAERLSFMIPHLAGGLALDLGSRTKAVALWFGGSGLYERSSSTYPPASYILLWPLVGWLPWLAVSKLWTLLCALSLGFLAACCVRREAIASHSLRWLGAMTMLALTTTSAVIWLGQLASLLMVAIIGAMWLLHSPKSEGEVKAVWPRELLAGALLLFGLVKPSVTAPFLWMILWAPRDAATPPLRRRIALGLGVLAGYGALTLVALWFQQDASNEVAVWAQTVTRNNVQLNEGYVNLRAWLAAIGLKPLSHPLAFAAFLWLGFWSFRHRHLDRLLLLSVTAIVARLWTYHNLYDDLLLTIPMLLLLQIGASEQEKSRRWQANGLLITLTLLLLLPADWMFERTPFDAIARTLFGLDLVAMLIFLLRLAKTVAPPAPNCAPPRPTPAEIAGG